MLRELFGRPPRFSPERARYLALRDRKPQDLPADWVEAQGVSLEQAIARQLGEISAAQRLSHRHPSTDPFGVGMGRTGEFTERRFRRRTRDLRTLSESAVGSRALTLMRNAIAKLDYGVRPRRANVAEDEREVYERAVEITRNVFDNPNATDDDFFSFVGPVVEDLGIFDAGCWEYVSQPTGVRNNPYLALEVVSGAEIALNSDWDGEGESIRWAQVVKGQVLSRFRDRDLEYLMQRRRSWTPFGLSPMEAALEILDAWLGVSAYQRDTASNAYPAFLLWLGENVGDSQEKWFRSYWDMQLRGRGIPGIYGNMPKPEVVGLKASNDEGLYLKYQEMLIRVIAYCFGRKPQDFGVERDVNRSQGEVGQALSSEEAIEPVASLIARKINTRVLPRLAEEAGLDVIRELEFFWIGLDPRDEAADARNHEIYLKHDVLTIDDVRTALDKPPMPNGVGQLTLTAYRAIAQHSPELLLEEEVRQELFPELAPEPVEGEIVLTEEDMAQLQERALGDDMAQEELAAYQLALPGAGDAYRLDEF